MISTSEMPDPVEIHVLDKTVRLLQPAGGFRTSLDSVMLAAACPARAGQAVLDLGCGVGGAGFCVLRRVEGARLHGVDIQPDYIDLARRNSALNGMGDRADFVCADMREFGGGPFDHAICNPPYLEAGAHTPAADEGRALANGGESDLKDWIDAAFRSLKSKGTLTLIHRADRIDKILQALGRRFGDVEIIPLWPHAGEAAKRIIVRAAKDRRGPAVLHPGIVLHEADGAWSAAAQAVLRDGRTL